MSDQTIAKASCGRSQRRCSWLSAQPPQTRISGSSTPRKIRTCSRCGRCSSGRPDVNVRSEDGSTALLWAAHWNDLQTAELLVRAGADANAANDFRMTPLSQACTNGSAAFVDLLLKAGANPNTPIGTGETPLMTCARAGSADAVRMLLVHGANVNAKEPNQNQTALMWAAAQQHPKVLADADRGRRGSPGPHQIGIYRAALCRASGRHGVDADAPGRRRRREHQIAARS